MKSDAPTSYEIYPSLRLSSVHQSQSAPKEVRPRCSGEVCRLSDARAARGRRETATVARRSIRGRENIRSAEILRERGATRLATSSQALAAADGYLLRP